jgi:hypothetical protein
MSPRKPPRGTAFALGSASRVRGVKGKGRSMDRRLYPLTCGHATITMREGDWFAWCGVCHAFERLGLAPTGVQLGATLWPVGDGVLVDAREQLREMQHA